MLLLALLLSACADLERGPGRDDAGAPMTTDGASLGFAPAIHALLVDGCARCHAPGGSAGGTRLSLTKNVEQDHASALASVDLGAPASSRLLTKAAGMGHGGGTIYAAGTPEHDRILHWIAQGALP